jgi:hypothetical protein
LRDGFQYGRRFPPGVGIERDTMQRIALENGDGDFCRCATSDRRILRRNRRTMLDRHKHLPESDVIDGRLVSARFFAVCTAKIDNGRQR